LRTFAGWLLLADVPSEAARFNIILGSVSVADGSAESAAAARKVCGGGVPGGFGIILRSMAVAVLGALPLLWPRNGLPAPAF
jgi:hypothetical protein